jgi:molecular chaperone DnaK (HSP70)
MATIGIDLGTSNSAADAGIFRETKVPPGTRVVDADYRETR